MSGIRDIAAYINKHDSFLIASHLNPDGDALGSALALSFALEGMGKRTVVYDRDGVPETYTFLPGTDRVITGAPPADAASMPLILLDCNAPVRAGLEDIAFKHACVIDHHVTETDFGSPRWIEPRNPATGLMVYALIKTLGATVTPEVATHIYTAIAVDTGTFRFPNTTPESLHIAAELVEAGAQPGKIAEHLYQDWSGERFQLLLNNLHSVELHGPIALTAISAEMFAHTGTSPTDTENFVNFPLIIHNVQVSALMREVEGTTWRISLRSKGAVDVSQVATQFGGGGHVNAAGCTLKGDLDDVKPTLLAALKSLPGV